MLSKSLQYYKGANMYGKRRTSFVVELNSVIFLLVLWPLTHCEPVSTCIGEFHYIKSIKCLVLDFGYIKLSNTVPTFREFTV